MNTTQATLLMAALGTFAQVVVGVYFYGRLAQKAETHTSDISDLKAGERTQWGIINDHGERLSYVEAKVNGKVH